MHENSCRGGPAIVLGGAEGRVMECVVQILRRVVERADEPWDELKESFGRRFIRFVVLVDQPEILRCLG